MGRSRNRGGGKSSLGETGIVLPTPVAFFAIKRVQVLAKMSKTGDTESGSDHHILKLGFLMARISK